jgi:hypothetical protein
MNITPESVLFSRGIDRGHFEVFKWEDGFSHMCTLVGAAWKACSIRTIHHGASLWHLQDGGLWVGGF